MILIDTGPIVALFDRDDRYHTLGVETIKTIRESLLSTWPVITECFYLLNFSWEIQDDLWLFLQRGGIEIYPLEKGHFSQCRELMEQYRDLPMDLADATLVALAETEGVSRVFTLDHKDFYVYRIKQKKRFSLLPPKLT